MKIPPLACQKPAPQMVFPNAGATKRQGLFFSNGIASPGHES